MVDNTIKATVATTTKTDGLSALAKQLDATLNKTTRNLSTLVTEANKGIKTAGEAGANATVEINAELKKLAVTLGQVKTLQNSLRAGSAAGQVNSAGLLGSFGNTATIGRQAKALAEYKASIDGTASALTTLKNRNAQVIQQAGILASNNKQLSSSQLLQSERIKSAEKEYGRLNTQMANLRGRVSLLGSDGQKALAPLIDQWKKLDAANASTFSDRRKSNFQPQLDASNRLVASIKAQVIAAEKLETKNSSNLQLLRQQAAAITNATRSQRDAAAATNIRASNTQFNNQKLLGTAPTLEQDVVTANRFTQTTIRANTAKARLTQALNQPNTSAQRLERLIAIHERYQRKIAETITAQNRVNSSSANQSNALGPLNSFGNTATIGRQAKALAEYEASINGTASALTTLKNRNTQIIQQAGLLASNNKQLSNSQLLQSERIKSAEKEYGRLNTQMANLRGRVSLLGSDGQKALAPLIDEWKKLDAANASTFSNRRRSNFRPELDASNRLVASIKAQVIAAEKLETKNSSNLQLLKQQAAAITNATRSQRDAVEATNIRASNRQFNNQKLLGTAPTLEQDIATANRYTQATIRANTAKARLTQAQNQPNTSAQRLERLIAIHERYQRKIADTITAQNRVNSSSVNQPAPPAQPTGFFAGLGEGRRRAFSGDEGGGSFGAGALVGRVGAYALAASAVYGVINALSQGVSQAIEFEDAMAQLQAVSGSTGLEMERLGENIFKVSQSSAESVLEITKAATVIAQAGFTGNELNQVLQSSVDLGAASGSTTAEAVDILTSSLGAFQLSGTEAARVADTLVAALNNSKLGINQVRAGLQFVGAIASTNNITVNELAATLGVLADAGIRGTTAATGLRQLLVDLVDPSDKLTSELERVGLSVSDIDVKVLGLNEVLRRLNDAGFQAFGPLETRAANVFQAIAGSTDALQAATEATFKQGAASEAAQVRTESLSATWQQWLNLMSEASSAIFEDLQPSLIAIVTVLGGVTVAILRTVELITELIHVVTTLGGIFDEAKLSTEDLDKALADSGITVEETGATYNQLASELEDVETASKATASEMLRLKTEQETLREEAVKLIVRQNQLAGENGNLGETTAQVSVAVEELSLRFPGLREEFEKTEGGVNGLKAAFLSLDLQIQKTLESAAHKSLVESELLRKQSLKSLGQTAFENRGRGSRADNSHLNRRGTAKPDSGTFVSTGRTLNALFAENSVDSLRKARNVIADSDDPRIRRKYEGTLNKLVTDLSVLDQANLTKKQAQETINRSQFLQSEPGQNLARTRIRHTGESTFIKSQGSRAEKDAQLGVLEGEMTRLLKLQGEATSRGDTGALNVISRAIIETRRDITSLKPQIEKSTGRGGGGSGTGSRGGGSRQADRAARDALKLEQDRLKTFNQNETQLAKIRFDEAKKIFSNDLDLLRDDIKFEGFSDSLQDLDLSLSDVIANEKEKTLARLEKNKLSEEQLSRLNEQQRTELAAQEATILDAELKKLEQFRLAEIRKVSDAIVASFKEYVSDTTKVIDQSYQEAIRFTQRNATLTASAAQGLSNPIGNENVGNSFRIVKQREADIAADRALRATIPAGLRKIEQVNELIASSSKEIRKLEGELIDLGRAKAEAIALGNDEGLLVIGNEEDNSRNRLIELRQVIQDLTNDNIKLKLSIEETAAALNAAADAPVNFSDGIRTAIQAVQIELNSSGSISQDIIKNLDQPVREAHQSFADFFSGIASGTLSVGQAFENMAGRIIDSIIQIAAQAVANQVIGLIANFASAGFGGGSSVSSGVSSSGGFFDSILSDIRGGNGSLWRGGEVKGYNRGGEITSGLGTRDSTLINAAKGEFIIRRSSAQSIGTDTLNSINARGAAALNDIGSNIIPINSGPPSETNVYVISPDEKPSLGPNDVLAIISNDVLKGGATKKLIKKVVNG